MREELLSKVLNLPKEDRLELMKQLLQSLKEDEGEDISDERLNLLEGRFSEIDNQPLYTKEEMEAYIKPESF